MNVIDYVRGLKRRSLKPKELLAFGIGIPTVFVCLIALLVNILPPSKSSESAAETVVVERTAVSPPDSEKLYQRMRVVVRLTKCSEVFNPQVELLKKQLLSIPNAFEKPKIFFSDNTELLSSVDSNEVRCVMNLTLVRNGRHLHLKWLATVATGKLQPLNIETEQAMQIWQDATPRSGW